ncbi:SDR family oxidoreductase [Rapidithrix thailandica]|uniref:SDR family oxidoreductase n=1 Tax=Rapidithrix thailandica TaxID=413964 RepID=A0AAW9S9N2_9BACT
MTMKGKTVIVTGGTSGIGKALAFEFGSKGANILITGRNQQRLDEVIQEFSGKGIRLRGIQADVSQEADNQRMVDAALQHFGCIDILINNAGMSMRALFEEVDLKVLHTLMNVNFWGTVYATKYALPHIIQQKGSVIGISSIAGYRGLPARAGYSASKFAMQGFLEVLRTEMLPKGVHVLTACPGFTASNIRTTALTKDGNTQGESPRNEGNMMSAEECASHIYKATCKRKKTLILTQQGKLTVFLNKLFPGWMDKMVFNHMAKEEDSPFKKL